MQKEQSNFLNKITNDSPKDRLLQVVILWRKASKQINYEWIEDLVLDVNAKTVLAAEAIINNTKLAIYPKIRKLLHSSDVLTYEVFVEVNNKK